MPKKLHWFANDPNHKGRGAGYYYHGGRGEWHKNERLSHAAEHSNRLGAGARAREHLTPSEKERLVLHEFKEGTLHSSSGQLVTDRKQAVAIALSEGRRSKYA